MIIYEEKKEKARRSGKRRMDRDSEISEDEKSVSERKRRVKKKICEIQNGKEIVKKLEKIIEKGKTEGLKYEDIRKRTDRRNKP